MFNSDNSEWKDIKDGIRRIKNVCEKITPLKKGVQCMSKVNEFEVEMLKLMKEEREYV